MSDAQERLDQIRIAFRVGRYEISREDYPTDKYGPSVLLLGFSRAGRPLHIQVADERTRIVTVYEPDPSEWLNWRQRRRSDHGH